MKKIRAIELFCGIGGFRRGLDTLGIETIWANDIDKLACRVYAANFGDTGLHCGDIYSLLDLIPGHDLLTGGFPCQPFSAAGKKEGVRDPRGTLFQAIVDILAIHRPRLFILENVKRLLSMENGTHFATILAALSDLGYVVEWRVLNARDFGLAQHRERVIITGTLPSSKKNKINLAPKLVEPTELRANVAAIAHTFKHPETWQTLATHGKKFPSWGIALDGKFIGAETALFKDAIAAPKLKEVLERNPAPEFDFTESTLTRLESSESVNRFYNGVQLLSNQGGGARMGYTVFGVDGLAPTLTASTSRHYERYKVGERYRRLTPVEYCRLQGFPDNHCSVAKTYDQYTLIGNAVPPQLIRWAARKLLAETKPCTFDNHKELQAELFDAYQ